MKAQLVESRSFKSGRSETMLLEHYLYGVNRRTCGVSGHAPASSNSLTTSGASLSTA